MADREIIAATLAAALLVGRGTFAGSRMSAEEQAVASYRRMLNPSVSEYGSAYYRPRVRMSQTFQATTVRPGVLDRLLATIAGESVSPATRDARLLIGAWLALAAFSIAILLACPQ
jgi:hypothetical protein